MVDKKKEELDIILKREKRQKIAAEHNPALSKRGRKILVSSLVLGALILVVFALMYAKLYSSSITSTRLIFTHSFLLSAVLIGILFGRKTLLNNKLGRNLSRSMILGAFGALGNAIAGHIYEVDTNLIMVLDMFIIGTAFGNSSDAIKNSSKIMLTCFLSGVMSLFVPDWTHQLLLGTVVISTLITMLDWYNEE